MKKKSENSKSARLKKIFARFAHHPRGTPFFSAGFTLVETLVAVVILMLSIVGPLTLAQKSMISAAYAKDQIIAFYLADEAVEYVRNVRDGNKLAGNGWFDDAYTSNCFNQNCIVDVNNSTISPCVGIGGACPVLNFKSSIGEYGYESGSGWQSSPFERQVTITGVDNSNPKASKEAKISAKVIFRVGPLAQKTVTVEENIFDW